MSLNATKTKKTLYLPTDIIRQVEILTTPPGHTQPPHGAWSGLIEHLIRTHLKGLPKEKRLHIDKMMLRYGEDLLDSLPSQLSGEPITNKSTKETIHLQNKQKTADSIKEALLAQSQVQSNKD